VDFVFVPGWVSHLESWWDADAPARFFRRIASFTRLIMFDKRGTGLSDPFTGVPTLEERSDDVRAVMEAVGSKSAFLCGLSEGGPMSVLFSAAYPDRTRGLILIGSNVRMLQSADWPHGWTREQSRPGEILVSRTVRDLVAGSGLRFAERGEHELKGVPDSWSLYAVAA
jgi:pimeloyl-ACP methyl ester carboxylesterase